MKSLANFYVFQFKIELAENFQYRISILLRVIGLFVEPIVYLTVWTTIAQAHGGSIAGYSVGAFTAYYFVSTLVRQMCWGLGPATFDDLVQQGTLSPLLLRPMHPFHLYLSSLAAYKVALFWVWLLIVAVMLLVYRPVLQPNAWQVIGFIVAVVLGFILRFSLDWVFGLHTFWITRVTALFQLYYVVELFLSGQFVPIALLPNWLREVTSLLPFYWGYGFPIELILGRLSPLQALAGYGAQLFWTAIALVAATRLWRMGIRRYTAVGA